MRRVFLIATMILYALILNAQNQPYLTLNNGVKMPQFGLGVYSIPAGETTYNSVLAALKAGYRHGTRLRQRA